VVAHVEDDDADDFVIVKVSLANLLAKQVKKKAEQIKAKAELGSSVTSGMASAAANAGVLGYRYAEHDDSEWANSWGACVERVTRGDLEGSVYELREQRGG